MIPARLRKALIVSAVLLCAVLIVAPSSAVIYGTDDRMDTYSFPASEPLVHIAGHSNVALIFASNIDCGDANCTVLSAPTLGEYYDLCPDERFVSQPTAAFCSGVLIDRDLVLTAGHCVTNQADCDDTVFVFGFEMLDADTPVTSFPETDVYFCSQIVARTEAGPIDYAILRMDRPAEGLRRPLPLRRAGAVELDNRVAGLLLLGHPSGIPLKFTGGPTPIGASGFSGASVKNAQPGWFESNLDAFVDDLDTFGGNSGSGVISLDERGDPRYVEGVLVGGPTDWVWDPSGSCYRRHVCEDATGCSGAWERITRATEFAHLVPYACGDERCDPTENEFSCPADCLGDLDGDGVEESRDNCPGESNPSQSDGDGDQAGDVCDCDPTDHVNWATPGEVRQMRLARDDATGESVIEWFPPQEEGSTALFYDVLRSYVPFDFLGPAVCVESDDGADRVARDADQPPPGASFFYLIRAQNDCPAGEGPLGFRSDGSPRLGVSCPRFPPATGR